MRLRRQPLDHDKPVHIIIHASLPEYMIMAYLIPLSRNRYYLFTKWSASFLSFFSLSLSFSNYSIVRLPIAKIKITFTFFLTWESLRPSFSASFLRSGLLMYFCIWNLFSRPRLWRSEKTALLIIPRRGFPRAFVAHGNTRPVLAKSPRPPWIAPGNAVPPPGAPGWWAPVPEPATTDHTQFTIRAMDLIRQC